MTKILIALLAVLLVFPKYGRPIAKFMSIHGDINFAMFENTLQETDKVGFIYENQNGDYALNLRYCYEGKKGEWAFHVQSDCTVQAQMAVTETPSDIDYEFIREKNFPEKGTASNYMVGRRVDPGYFTSAVLNGGVAYAFSDIRERVLEKRSRIWCNDKNNKESKELFTFWNSNVLTVIFRKDDSKKYDQTMKCLANTLKEKNHRFYFARLFTVIIAGRTHIPFTFQPFNLKSNVAEKYNAITFEIPNEIKNTIQTKFVFRANGCPPAINMETVDEERNSISITYDGNVFKMPAIETVGLLSCGIAYINPFEKLGSSFTYWCDCNE